MTNDESGVMTSGIKALSTRKALKAGGNVMASKRLAKIISGGNINGINSSRERRQRQ